MKKPIIGITPQFDTSQTQTRWHRLHTSISYFDAIAKAGGIPIMLPWQNDEDDVTRIVESLDGIVIAGGNDISPLLYGENVLEQCGDITPIRDESELLLTKFAYKNSIPLLGICRGCQTINVAMGGSLYQDIPSQLDHGNEKIIHSQKTISGEYPSHRIKVSKDSRLYDCFGKEEILVNSFHHQAAKKVALNLFVSAFAEDGLVEAVESVAKDRFFIGVQWHPEMMVGVDEDSRRLFRYFIDAVMR